MFVLYMIGTLIVQQYYQLTYITGMRARAALIAACYDKTLRLSMSARSQKTVGQIMTMITVDIRKIRDVYTQIWLILSYAFRIIISIYLLYQQIQWSVFVPIALQIAFMVYIVT